MCHTTTESMLYHGIIGCYATVMFACSMVSSHAINNSLCTMVCSPTSQALDFPNTNTATLDLKYCFYLLHPPVLIKL
jgi:hypothetical protein